LTALAAALLLSSQLGHQFDGLVAGASEKGTWVHIFTPHIEGKLVGGYAGLQVGDRVHVQFVHTDVQHGFIDFTGNTGSARQNSD
jgi:exoribonuclease-2